MITKSSFVGVLFVSTLIFLFYALFAFPDNLCYIIHSEKIKIKKNFKTIKPKITFLVIISERTFKHKGAE